MSGGYFDYREHELRDMADRVYDLIKSNGVKDPYGFTRNYSPDVLARFEIAAGWLERACGMVHAIDYLVCDDIGEEEFLERWNGTIRSAGREAPE